ncbi:Pollen Ole e 1 allergen/extensin [Quillaja saponaria]|uniref:Pollen Ole e 1 allergen/extensin n=1 Tax=Quillaja saponaria TaxID=32244 RepID=A0AAD7VIC3_QUISA|nr:Pollen Ole e 1 allergen/extensin [Quillaja saponaria]
MGVVVTLIIAASFIMGFSNMVVAGENQPIIHVGGKVLCQDCTQGWNEWVHGSRPIKGCKVSLTCLDERSRVMYYASDITDEVGQYKLIVNKYNIYGKELNTKLCALRLVSSPDPTCNILTNFGGGKSGVKLGLATSEYKNLIKYVLDPFYYTTPLCDKPDINESNYGNGSNY